MKYICKLCKTNYCLKSNYNRHVNRKEKRDDITNIFTNINNFINDCYAEFTQKKSISSHVKNKRKHIKLKNNTNY